jgi:Zn-dependent protease/CBS domain-containing protein
MNWSYRLTRIAGIDVNIHITFYLIVILGALQWGLSNGLAGAIFGATLIIFLFACVVLHELGHSIVARYFGIQVREIILLPLGGLALMERQPEKPLHELLIAAAGPLVNVIIAAVLIPIVGATADLTVLNERGMVPGVTHTPSFTILLMWLVEANITLVLFNLIPAFPLDGGRILRALLAMFLGHPRATRLAIIIGQSLAIFIGVFGVLSGNFILALVAVFIFFGASHQGNEGKARTVLHTRCVGDAYNKHVLTLTIGDRLNKVIDYILTSTQRDFAVMQGQNLLGIVTRDEVIQALSTSSSPDVYAPDVYVQLVMRRDVTRVNATMPLDEVRQFMMEKHQRVVAVYDEETYLGLVSLEDIQEAFVVLSFLERYHESREKPTTTGGATPTTSG